MRAEDGTIVEAPGTRPRRRRLRRLLVLAGLAAAEFALLLVAATAPAVRDGASAGRAHLYRAQSLLSERRYDDADGELRAARAAFADAQRAIDALGPLAAVARVTPLVRTQMRAAEAFTDAGIALADSAADVSAAARAAEARSSEPFDREGLALARAVGDALDRAARRSDRVAADLARLNGKRLFGPLEEARSELADALPTTQRRLRGAADDVAAVLDFVGAGGGRRYLVLTQNPDEARPTGGFIGSYGVLLADEGDLRLEHFSAVEEWLDAHPDAVTDPELLPVPFRLLTAGALPQTLANANAATEWSAASAVAVDLWAKGGQEPVDGVLSLTPELLARIVRVLGAVTLPDYGEEITADNLVEKVDFYTHDDPLRGVRVGGRKGFLVVLAKEVMTRLADMSLTQAQDLAAPLADGMSRREGMAWASTPRVRAALARHGWDGSMPAGPGDHFYDAEFAYATKVSRDMRRTYSHRVQLRADGSASIATTVQVDNTAPPEPVDNVTGAVFTTFFGPRGAILGEVPRPPTAAPFDVRGHPGVGYLVTTPPLGSSTTELRWEAPAVARREGGALVYRLRWLTAAGRTGSTLRLEVTPPSGWSWRGSAPPSEVNVSGDFAGEWRLEPNR